MRRTKFSMLLSLLAVAVTLQLASPAQAQRVARPGKVAQRAAGGVAKAKAKARAKAKAVVRAPAKNTAALLDGAKLRTGTQASGALVKALKASRSTYFVRDVNGAKRIIANIAGQDALNKVGVAMGKKSDVIQILHIGLSNIQHTMAIFDGELVHTQYIQGTSNWRLGKWGNMLRASNTKMFSAFIALSPAEATKLRDNIKQGREDQGPEHLAGPNWANGKLKNTSMGGCRSFNCASVWADMPLGKNGKTLGEIAGVGRNYSGNPRMLQKALETSGNERVIGVAVYGPKIQGFEANPAKPVVEL